MEGDVCLGKAHCWGLEQQEKQEKCEITPDSQKKKKNHKEYHTGEKVAFSNLREQRQKVYIN